MISKFIFNNQYLFDELPDRDKELLRQVMQAKNYRKNEAIFTERTTPNGIFYLKSGKVKKYKVDNDGREQIIYIYNAGEFFGYSAILSDDTYGDTAQAIENSAIAFISKTDFLRILDQSVVFSRLLLKSLSHEFSVMANLMTVLSQRTVRERVALSLLILHKKYTSNTMDDKVYITLSRANLASMVGTANETLARILHDFREDRLIAMEGRKIQIMDVEKLSRIANL
ncbi:cAMP-binding domain of CRP or a regulatory subunit of cAMP-dependent protein kinases [Chryseobacterium wanjuense]|jgi:CRP-like cAMP-binding protein|uniref:cAMP-binding domain of CRP or a regulatory subunit of cAMP-dependent protein kinases n=1 Tax=Chryseobacterium wanjuense TaxID=356305 RepID=A0A1I0Q843_9FLAO|nr:Crp/Fnr family transcriptional regulator [Chryseobacterium wanjuense]SEW23047.1 cAMP-binding domain of CRP or a regulatory subunit of cAMP-dependent protein kinases [Chryseobacterium wanjuense]